MTLHLDRLLSIKPILKVGKTPKFLFFIALLIIALQQDPINFIEQ